MNKKIFPLFMAENIQLPSAHRYAAPEFLMKIFSSGGPNQVRQQKNLWRGVYEKHPPGMEIIGVWVV